MSVVANLENYLYSLSSTDTVVFREEVGLVRAKKFYTKLGNPQNNFRSIHVAGTSGKGSVCTILSSLLRAHGFRVGTHLSPHVMDVRERMMINLEYPADAVITRSLAQLQQTVASMAEPISYFEASVGMGFLIFENQQVDYAVVETGLGGTVDATNTIDRADKLAIITRLGIDHERVLGSTIESIAPHKAGIIQSGNHALALAPYESTAATILKKRAEAVGATLEFVHPPARAQVQQTETGISLSTTLNSQPITVQLPSYGLYQAENIQLALTALEYLADRDKFTVDANAVTECLAHLSVPGRATKRIINNTDVIFDGAHNTQKMEGLAASVAALYETPPLWVFGARNNKNISAMLKTVATFADGIVFTPFISKQANAQVYSTAAQPTELQTTWKQYSNTPSYTATSPRAALELALQHAQPHQPIIVTGSLYLVGELLARLNPAKQ